MRSTKQPWTWLRPFRAILLVLIVVNVLSLPVGVLQLFNGRYVIGTVDFHALFPQGQPRPTQAGITFGSVDFFWGPTDAYQTVLFGLSQGLGWIVATLPMLVYAHHVTDEALRNDPFTMTMVRKLRTLGLLILVGGLVAEVVVFAAGWALLDEALANEPGLRAGANLELVRYPSVWWLLCGLMVLGFAEVVRRGCLLRAELDDVI
jgi:hypothetical protein